MILLLAAACNWVDLDDCRVAGEGHCDVFLPEGYLCALAHNGFYGAPGSGCAPPVPSSDGDIYDPLRCPEGFVRGEAADNEASAYGEHVTCAAVGTAGSSSADLAEVPRGAACGFNHGNSGGTQNLCMGLDPGLGECPPGTELRWTYDIHGDKEGGPFDLQADLLVWCEVGDQGCAWGECPATTPPVCGLHGGEEYHADDATWMPELLFETMDARLAAVVSGVDPSEVADGSCDGLPEGECPDGMTLVCTPEVAGNAEGRETILPEALCWCALAENERVVDEIALRTP